MVLLNGHELTHISSSQLTLLWMDVLVYGLEAVMHGDFQSGRSKQQLLKDTGTNELPPLPS